mmetsp:Transcript_39745/g.93083  ORF Transcript_39745/g.93083 Transcript_39745/m.93083 type:complete len:826 (-) Transcript_39745:217-2694(-)
MRLSVTLPFLTSILWTSSARASNVLSRHEVASIMTTVATEEVPLFSSSADSFEKEVQAQWDLNQDVEALYLVCDTAGKRGFDRVQNVASKCELPKFVENTMQNLLHRTCFNVPMFHAIAQACAQVSETIDVVPYTPWLKVSPQAITGSFGNATNITEPVLRYAAYFFNETLPKVQKTELKNLAKIALQVVWEKATECEGNFRDTFRVFLEGNAIKLHQKQSMSESFHCVLKLIENFAAHHFVGQVEFDPPVTIDNNNGRWIIQGSVMEGSTMIHPMHEAGITGMGQVAQMSDTGLSVNSCYFYDATGEVVRDKSESVDSSRRKVVQYYAKVSSEDESGHGTHCAGTILGKICSGTGCSPSGQNRDGIAYDAKIAVYDIGTTGSLSPGFADMLDTGIKAGAFIHSASWGNRANFYQTSDRDYDKFLYENSKYMFFKSAGNQGSGSALNTVSGVAKNNINVCSSLNKGISKGEMYASAFSSMGPTADGRIKPDICAPGSAINSASKTDGTTRNCNSRQLSGTSMACPGTAGAALLIRQYFMDGFYPSGTKVRANAFTPSGALIKAIILNSGRPMLGREDSTTPSTPYDQSQGFGLISLVDGVYLKDRSKGKVLVWDDVEVDNGQIWEEVIVLDNSCPATTTSVMLVYADKEASYQCTECLINRLDLTVTNRTHTMYPNGKTGPDTKNNAQRIRMPKNGNPFTVKVEATNLVTASQKFALVVSGCVDIGTLGPTKKPVRRPTVSPVRKPTVSPVRKPTFSPVPPSCQDDPEFRMFKNKKTTCSWIGGHPRRYMKYCRRKRRFQKPVCEICCLACSKCDSKRCKKRCPN